MKCKTWALATGIVFLSSPLLFLLAGTPWQARADGRPPAPPRFTEEREAAALFFVKKNLPELLPLLEQLKKNSVERYELEIREIFQVTELLADLRDEPRRYELELKIWKTENRAHALVGQLSTPSEDERKKIEGQLQELAKELVDLDVQELELRAEELDKELGEVKDELTKLRDNLDKQTKERYEMLLEKVKKRKK
jgi:hypothetical protein